MPSVGGPVYQPTTVSYEPRRSGSDGPTSVGNESPLRRFRKSPPLVGLLLFAIISFAAGVAMLASGFAKLFESEEFPEENADNSGKCEHIPMGLFSGGVLMTFIGIMCMGVYVRVAAWRPKCACGCSLFDKKQSLARHINYQHNGGQNGIRVLNPSTDPLVSHTQYTSVSELPSLRPEDEERRNLMPDSKDCLSSAEESDRMLEPDPRIVLRPMGRLEDA